MCRVYALLSSQGTACLETVLRGDEYTEANRRAIEAAIVPHYDAPVPGTWTDVSDNDAVHEEDD